MNSFKEILISQSVLTGYETWAYGSICFGTGCLTMFIILWKFGYLKNRSVKKQ